MSKHKYENHGSTVSGAIILGLLAMCAVGLARADSVIPQPCAHLCSHHGGEGRHGPTSADSYERAAFDPTETQLVMQEPQIVETITCASYSVHYDAQGYGSVQGAGCDTTGPLVLTRTGTLGGHVAMTFYFNDGSTLTGKNCRVDSHVELASPGANPYDSYALNCI